MDEGMIIVTPIVAIRLASPQGGIYIDKELYRIASSSSEESVSYVDKVLATSWPQIIDHSVSLMFYNQTEPDESLVIMIVA